jgi:hypothetical protein
MIKFLKKLSFVFLFLFLAVSAYADSAKQIDFLLAGYRHPTTDEVLSGGKVKSFLDGTSTLSALFTDKDKGGTAANPAILDSSGKAELYGDNIYKFEIYDSDDVLIETITGAEYKTNAVLDGFFPDYSAADQGVTGDNNTLKYYIDTIGSDQATIVLRHNSGSTTTTYTLTTSETIPSNIKLNIEKGSIINGAGILTINGTIDTGEFQIFGASIVEDSIVLSNNISTVYAEWWGIKADGTDDSVALQAGYTAAGTATAVYILPAKTMTITTGLLFYARVDVFGVDGEKTELQKSGDIIGIKIGNTVSALGQDNRYQNFTVTGTGAAESSAGIEVWSGSFIKMEHVNSNSNGSHGFHIRGGGGYYADLVANSNQGDGIRVDGSTGFGGASVNASTFHRAYTRSNVGAGFRVGDVTGGGTVGFSAANKVYNLVSEQNAYGLIVDDIQNYIEAYVESNTTMNVQLTANSIRTIVILTGEGGMPAEWQDLGTNNSVWDMSDGRSLMVPAIAPSLQTADAAGRTFTVSSGAGGPGGTGTTGGLLQVNGGDGNGTNGTGGTVWVQGGTPTGTGTYGRLRLQGAGGVIHYKISTLADDATPTVGNGYYFLTGGTTTITDFDDGVEGQEIKIIAEHSITITDGTNIFLSGSANYVMAATDTLMLIQKADGKWYEMARSNN